MDDSPAVAELDRAIDDARRELAAIRTRLDDVLDRLAYLKPDG